jgi:hypothetical protein
MHYPRCDTKSKLDIILLHIGATTSRRWHGQKSKKAKSENDANEVMICWKMRMRTNEERSDETMKKLHDNNGGSLVSEWRA